MNTDGKKILIISSEFPPNAGGIGNHAYHLARSLANEGYSVRVVADVIGISRHELLNFSIKQNFQVRWINRKKFVLGTYIHRVLSAIRHSLQADLIICSGKFSLWLGKAIRLLFKKKVLIAVVHGSELDIRSPLSKRITSSSLKAFNKIIAVSSYTLQFLPASLPEKIETYVIHNGIDLIEFNQRSTSLPGAPALITIGSVTERKGQENVIKALPQIISKYPAVQYHVVGKPVWKERLTALSKQLKVDDAIHFYGAVSRNELLAHLAGSQIKLMLSNHTGSGDFEGFGIAVLEANAFGKPVIGSRNSGIADAIVHEKTGILVDPANAEEITNAIKTLLANYEVYSANAKEWAAQHDWQLIIKRYLNAFKN